MSATILIVEDEYAVARGIQYALEQEGYQVTLASSGEEALEVALREPDLFRGVVMMRRTYDRARWDGPFRGEDLPSFEKRFGSKKLRASPSTSWDP